MRAWQSLRRFLARESGSTTVEYAILLAFVVLVMIAGVYGFKMFAGDQFDSAGETVGTYGP